MHNREPGPWYADLPTFITGILAAILSVVAGAVAANSMGTQGPFADSSWAVITRTVALIAWLAVFTAIVCHTVKARSAVIRAGQHELANKLDALTEALKNHDDRVDAIQEALTQLPGAVQVWGDSRLTDGILHAMERARTNPTTNGSRPQLRSVDN